MIFWGSNGENLDLGKVKEEQCDVCEKKRPYHLYLSYRWWHLYWIFGVLTKVKYMLLCEVCNRGWEIDKKDLAELHKKAPIPFWRRYGLLSFGVIIVLLIIWGSI
jgi:hypothetical protein